MPEYKVTWTAYTPIYKVQTITANSLKEAAQKAEPNNPKGNWTLLATEEEIECSGDCLHQCELEHITDEDGIEHPRYTFS